MPDTTTQHDVAYLGVGLAVLAWRQTNEAFNALDERLTSRNETVAQGVSQARERLANLRTQVEEFWAPYVDRFQAQVDGWVGRLPDAAQNRYHEAVKAGREFAAGLEQFTKTVQEGTATKRAPKKAASKAVA